MSSKIYSVGHSNHLLDDFVQLLQVYRVGCLVDVRKFPSSRKHPHFAKNTLAQALQRTQMEYVWLGDQLGGYRDEGYENHMRTEMYRSGIADLIRYAARVPTAFMCSERLFTHCHRKFVADTLTQEGWHVQHILDANRVSEHQLSLCYE